MIHFLEVEGKHIFINGEKFIIKGISYGNFDPADTGTGTYYFNEEKTRADFKLIKEANINTVRLYSKPPEYVMEIANEFDIKIILTLFIDYISKDIYFTDGKTLKYYKKLTEDLVNFGKKYKNVILYMLGTEVAAMLADRDGVYEIEKFILQKGQGNFENFIFELHKSAKYADPSCLTSYSNYPPTEFLNLDFLDVITFDIYLHTEKELREYLSRLQNYTASKPLLIGEAGADTVTQGDEYQAEMLRWSIESSLDSGCCGFVAYTFADGWWSGQKVTDWKMGILTEDRTPRIAYYSIQDTFKMYGLEKDLPEISVVVATYNGAHYIYKCLNALIQQDYPKDKYEIIVVVDGSKDKTVEYAKKYPVRIIELKQNGGLSNARNVGAQASKAEIIAYTDDDCEPDSDWLYYLAKAFDSDRVGAAGGPNITPVDDSFMAKCTSQAPGAPTHVLIDDRKADHVPGCNLAIRKYVMDAIGGFDEIFRIAGDDVDMEWRIQEAGYIIRFTPAAYVFHHRRDKIRTYIKQQYNYGISEAFVRQRHAQRFNGFSAIWRGLIYNTYNNSANNLVSLFKKPIIYFGWFPEVYRPQASYIYQLPLDIRWHFTWLFFILLSPFSIMYLYGGIIMFIMTILTCAVIAKIAVSRKHIRAFDEFREFFVITLLSFLWSFARRYGQFKGEMYVLQGKDIRGKKI